MVFADLFLPVLNTIYTALTASAVITTDVLVPTLSVAVGAPFTIAGTLVDNVLKGGSEIEQRERFQIVADQLEHMIGSFSENQETLEENQEMLKGAQTMLKSNAEESRHMFKEIQVKLQSFEDIMIRKFEELKVFMLEKDFSQKVQEPMDSLWALMDKANELRNQDSVEQFLDQYKKDSARTIIRNFIHGLNYKYSNPIISAMEQNVLESRSILDNYTKLLSHFIFKMLAIEGFYYSVSDRPKSGTDEYLDTIGKDADSAMRSFRNFVGNYTMKTELYWPDLVKTTVQSKLSPSDGENLPVVVDRLKDTLQGIYTKDVFAINMFNYDGNHQGEAHYYYAGQRYENKYDKFIINTVPGHIMASVVSTTRAIVQRTTKSNEISPEAYSLISASYRAYASFPNWVFQKNGPSSWNSLHRLENLEGWIYMTDVHTYFNQSGMIHGFVAYNITPVVRYTNNGYSLLTDEDLGLIPLYHGLAWA